MRKLDTQVISLFLILLLLLPGLLAAGVPTYRLSAGRKKRRLAGQRWREIDRLAFKFQVRK